VEAEARQALTNLGQVLVDAGSGLDRVLKTTVFLTDMADFAAVNAVYAEFFLKDPPARSTVAAAGLPRGARFEVEAVAVAR
jgi:2-iminobutanoate/2-iminopropanoate deaminase